MFVVSRHIKERFKSSPSHSWGECGGDALPQILLRQRRRDCKSLKNAFFKVRTKKPLAVTFPPRLNPFSRYIYSANEFECDKPDGEGLCNFIYQDRADETQFVCICVYILYIVSGPVSSRFVIGCVFVLFALLPS